MLSVMQRLQWLNAKRHVVKAILQPTAYKLSALGQRTCVLSDFGTNAFAFEADL